MTDYQQLMDAVAQYYGVGSDEWAEIAKYGVSAENAESILSQVPGVNIVKNANGTIRSYNLTATENVVSSAEQAVNSNVPAVVKSFDVPANTAVDAAGEMTFASGMAQAGNFVFTKVVPAVAAAGVGIELGKLFDKVLYNANPDFWDEKGMSTLNPDVWGEIIGTDTLGGRGLNMILGTTPDNKTQAYLDQNALAYMASYMQNKGVFTPEDIYTSDTVVTHNNKTISVKQSPQVQVKDGLPKDNTFLWGDINGTYQKETVNVVDGAKYAWTSAIGMQYDPTATYYIISNKPFTVRKARSDGYSSIYSAKSLYNILPNMPDLSDVYPAYIYYTDYSTAVAYNPLYPGILNNIYLLIIDPNNPNRNIGNPEISCSVNNYALRYDDYLSCALFSYFYGEHVTSGGIEGIGTQENAKTPDLSGATTVQETLDALKQQYPELFNNAVTQNVVQPDGSTVTYTYVPIAMPELTPEGNPVSSTSTQANPQIDPATATAPLLDVITKLLQKDNPVNPPDTGSGDSPIVVPATGSASALYAIYNPTLSQINAFGAWLWSDNFIEQIKKLFNDPMQAIIGLHKVYATPATSGAQNIKVGYLDSGVSANVVSNQYTTIDCGTVTLSEYFHNVFDYAPYTQINLYLPFIGIVNLDNADVMRSSIHIIYHVDVLSGACLAEVKVTRDGAGGTLYQYTGNASVTLPISSGSYMGIVTSIASIAGGIAGTIASGGAALPMLASAAGSALNARAKVEHSGGFSGNAGAMGGKIPYLIISRPQVALANNFQKYIGYPANYTTKLSNCSGYVKVLECHVENVNATNTELTEIESLLKEGVLV